MVKEWYWNRSVSKEESERPGCMRGMFHFFDFHHLLFTGGCRTPAGATSPPANDLQFEPQHQQRRYQASQCKGLEAPRNSLEIEDSEAALREDYFGVPISIRIPHPSSMARKKAEFLLEEENRKSQAVTPRTRSIVARLMGLEEEVIGNESTSESNECSKKKKSNKGKSIYESKRDKTSPRRPLRNLNSNLMGSISLPDTPRASTEKLREVHPRHSLQLNKENVSYNTHEFGYIHEVLPAVSSTLRTSKTRKKDYFAYQEEIQSPKKQYFAREIVKQMTSSIHNDYMVTSRSNKQTDKKCFTDDNSSMNQLQPAHSFLKLPPTRLSSKSNFSESFKKSPQHKFPTSINLSKHRAKAESNALKIELGQCSKASYERFTGKIQRQPPDQSSLYTGRIFPPTKKGEEALKNHFSVEKEDPEFKYLKAILARADVVGANSMKWFSPSLPIDPTIFHILELWFPYFEPDPIEAKKVEEATARLGPLRHRWNRKLLFHLVEEILGDLLLSDPKQWRRRSDSEILLSRLWSTIRGFPYCRVIGDVDAMVEGDLPESKLRRLLCQPSVVAEAKDIALEIQRDILDSLLVEATAFSP